jgi:hypothetical protein
VPISSLNSTNKTTPQTNYINANGGEVSEYSSGGVNYKVHIFRSSQNFVVNSGSNNVDYLVIAGGGAGGGNGHVGGGGGGAGGYLEGQSAVSAGTYAIVVGAGGVCPAGQGGTPLRGFNSSFNGITSTGGGGGGNHQYSAASTGGSGGGGMHSSSPGGAGTAGQGNAGGNGVGGSHHSGAGGGGAGGVGSNAIEINGGTNSGAGGS